MTEEAQKQYLIAVGIDGSESSWKAMAEAIRQTKSKQAQLHVISIQETAEPNYNATEVLTTREHLERMQMKARMMAESEGINVETHIVPGSSSGSLIDFAKKASVDLLVIGDTGHSSIWGVLLGKTADKIVRTAPCSVLIVR